MARKQSRKSVSMNRHIYEAAKLAAEHRGVTLSALVESALAAVGVAVVEHPQQTVTQVAARTAARNGSKAVRRPSRERQLLGDTLADACGFS